MTDEEWARLCDVLDEGERDPLAGDARFATPEAREANAGALAVALGQRLAQRDADEWERLLIAVDVGCVRADGVIPGEFFLRDGQALANGCTQTATHALWGDYQRWGPLVSFSATPGRYGPGVLPGQHADAILEELGYDAAEVARLREAGVVWSDDVPAIETMLPE